MDWLLRCLCILCYININDWKNYKNSTDVHSYSEYFVGICFDLGE